MNRIIICSLYKGITNNKNSFMLIYKYVATFDRILFMLQEKKPTSISMKDSIQVIKPI